MIDSDYAVEQHRLFIPVPTGYPVQQHGNCADAKTLFFAKNMF